MNITRIELEDLPSKHYSTELSVTAEQNGDEYDFTINISGYGPKPSRRSLEGGWEPDWGMDHVESDIHLFLAEMIKTYFEKGEL
jgi:hypothetical protein